MAKVAPVDEKTTIASPYDDDYSVTSSNLNDEPLPNESARSVGTSKRDTEPERGESTFIKNRNALRDSVLKEVMEAILPDIGAYDIDGMAPRSTNESSQVVRALKYLGFMDLDIHEAVLSGSLKHVKRAVKKMITGKKANPALINQYDMEGMTPLSLAVKILNMDIIDYLLDHDALPDIIDERTGRTPLHFSVLAKAHLISQNLINYNASVDMPDFQCITPLMLAASQGDIVHVKMLIDKAAEVDARDENGWTPLHYATNANAVKCVVYLMREGANRHVRDLQKRRPLDIARFRDFGDIIALLSANRLQW